MGWSPTGDEIVFAAGPQVYAVRSDGTGLRAVSDAADERGPDGTTVLATSPDWTQVVYASCDLMQEHGTGRSGRFDYEHELVLASLDGSEPSWAIVRHPVVHAIESAAWSPDGTRIAMSGKFQALWHNTLISHASPRIALVTIAADGTDVRVLVGRRAHGTLAGLGVAKGDISAEVAACGADVVVPDPEANPGLVEDGETLLEVQNALAGPGGLGWLVDKRIGWWEGVAVDGSPPRVREVVLRSRELVGEMPIQLSRLTELRVLDMARNALTGAIPPELGELMKLERLDLTRNYLSGEIPPQLGGLSQLPHLLLGGNNLLGKIPAELGQLTNLSELRLSYNLLRVAIPEDLRPLTGLEALEQLFVTDNWMKGCMPEELVKFPGKTDDRKLKFPSCE